MRYSPEHKQETRERIVHAASRRFRKGGAGVGIGQLMKSLKLTHGGFYRHFDSKDDLVVAALSAGFDETRSKLNTAIANAKPEHELEAIVTYYLSEQHCHDAASGCPVASLAAEVARQPHAVRAAFEKAMSSMAAIVSKYVRGATEEERRRKAGVLMTGMSGTLAVARALSDEQMRRNLLATARATYIEAFAR
ncbi:MAG TPA: TetR/AcrR family transcriptional regulator [Thermoanaerobaculia bacterium]|nr:TetR/AcrR family transcriptional regulator [Thermoanaerobaculia bacterium]